MPLVETILTIDDLDVHYGGSRILRDVSMDIPNGSIVAVMGRNGVGKTTLLKAIMGLVEPSKGSVCFDGDDITTISSDRR